MWVIFKMSERLDQHKGRAGAQCAYNRVKTALSAEDVACVDRVTAAGPDRIKFFLKNEGAGCSDTVRFCRRKAARQGLSNARG